jgi:predicted amidohydrolase
MRPPLIVAVAQPRIVSQDVAANALTHASVIRTAAARVVVFPELSLTGYELEAPAIDVDDPRLAPIAAACAETGAIALAGAPANDTDGRPTIAMVAFDGSGTRIVYRKMWLGEAERERFAPGQTAAVIEIDGWRVGLAICKDTRMPQQAADTAALGIDAYVAGIVESEAQATAPTDRARRVAADHHVWVAIASHAGPTGGGFDQTAGGSGVWRPDGSVVEQAGAEPGAIVRATLT